jgi:hypothetical protein
MTDAELAELLLLGRVCNDCKYIFWLLIDPTWDCRYTRARRSHERDPAMLNWDPVFEKFSPIEGLDKNLTHEDDRVG